MSKKWINDKNSKTFALVHRSHEDPEFYNDEVGENVFVAVHKDQKKENIRLQTKDDIEQEINSAITDGNIRKNEGEAALFGITYDDSKYDYMKHLRTIGSGEGVFIPSKPENEKKKDNEIIIKSPEELLEMPSKDLLKYDYQRQQNIPDAISGFKPDINPDLREVLVALEDEDYLDAEYDVDDADIFDKLLNEKDDDEDEGGAYIEEEEAEEDWDIDNYEDDYAEYDSDGGKKEPKLFNENWEQDYKKFQNKQKSSEWDSDDDFDSDEDDLDEEAKDTFGELPNLNGLKSKSQKKKEKRSKGAKTDTSSYSMSSSALCRTEQLTIIDDKFDVMREKYDQEEDDDYKPFDFKNERSDFEGMIDDFLDNYTLGKGGRKIMKKDPEAERLKEAADSVSKSKLAARRLKEKKAKGGLDGLTSGMNNLKF